MRDEYDDRIYQAFRQDLGNAIARLFKSIAHAFDRLNARLYAAPWSEQTPAKARPCSQLHTVI